MQQRLQTIQQQIIELEDTARKAINDRIYFNAANVLDKEQALIQQYEKTLNQLNQVQKASPSLRLRQNVDRLETLLIDRLSKIKIVGPSEKFLLNKPEMPLWKVSVQDEFGPLPGLPLIAKQGRQTLSERRTQAQGEATFNLRNVNFDRGPYTITVEPSLPQQFVRASGLQDALVISYSVNQSKCKVQLQCNEVANICNAVERGLAKKSIFVEKDGNSPVLALQTTARVKNSAGGFNTFDINVILRGDGIYFTESTKGAGKNEIDAIIKSINKIDFSRLQEQLSNCN